MGLLEKARESHAALKGRLVDLYNALIAWNLTDEERERLRVAIGEAKAKIKEQTRRLCGDPEVKKGLNGLH